MRGRDLPGGSKHKQDPAVHLDARKNCIAWKSREQLPKRLDMETGLSPLELQSGRDREMREPFMKDIHEETVVERIDTCTNRKPTVSIDEWTYTRGLSN